jgi:hypothetical protein
MAKKVSRDLLIEAIANCIDDAGPKKKESLFAAMEHYRKKTHPRVLKKSQFAVDLLAALEIRTPTN